MFDVLCLSDCCCDMIFSGLRRIPAPGTEEYCEQLYCKAGGGANTAMGLAKLGCNTAYATMIGDDIPGRLIMDDLAAAGVNSAYISCPEGARTWVSAVLSTGDERAFASFAGRGVAYTARELQTMVGSARWVHTYYYYCERFPELARLCRKAGVPFSVDSSFTEGQNLVDIRPVLEQAELFTPNDAEACALTGKAQAEKALGQLAGVCRNVVVTMGKRGCIASLEGRRYTVLPPEVRAVDANGAGDLFNAGFLAARLAGRDAETQLRWAAASGALAVTYAGGMDESYTKEKVAELTNRVIIEKL